MRMKAAVRNENGETMVIESEYETKQAFKNDLHANGYTVIGRIEVEGEKRNATYDRGCR